MRPYLLKAWMEYSLHDGVKRHVFGSNGLMATW
jgi:hypothetical protein